MIRYLGVEIEDLLRMKQYSDNMYKNTCHRIHILRSLSLFAAVRICKSMIINILDYGNIFLMNVLRDRLNDLQKLQNNVICCT